MEEKKINDGGPAFAMGYHPEGNSFDHSGLTKREYFAGLAMQGYCADHEMGAVENVVEWSVKCADALIAELSKSGGGCD